MVEDKKLGSVMIVGGGITGMQTALDLADSGYYVYLVERTGAIGGAMAQLDKTFPTNDCSMCIVAPKLVECGRHLNIKLMTLSEVTAIDGEAGNFTVTVKESPRYVDMEKCIACGDCTTACPKSVPSEFDALAGERKAAYIKYPQAVPLRYQIDDEHCIYLNEGGGCGLCAEVCEAEAINFDDTGKTHHINVGAVVLSPGFEPYDPSQAGVWGYGSLPNVITSLQLERFVSTSGPTEGRLVRPSDGRPVSKVAFLQCIGSRDENLCGNGYCSSVCCMYAIKEAMLVQEHTPELASSIFFMDMRTPGKEFDRYLEKARNEVGIRFVRCKVNGVEASGDTGDLRLSYVNEQGRQVEEYYDLVVLSVGLQTSTKMLELADVAGIRLAADRFAATSDFAPAQTSREGIYSCGAFSGPKDIPQSVVEGSAAAAAVSELLAPARFELSSQKSYPPERRVDGEEPRLGVFICHCGSNIAGIVDVGAVEQYAATLPNVTHVEKNLFACSEDAQQVITRRIAEHNLNRIVIAACTPRTHEQLFRETLKTAGLNTYLVEMANIRNQNSWVHKDSPEMATQKAKDLVRMAAAKVGCGGPLQPVSMPVIQKGLVVGGGVAGMTAALNLSEQGFEVHLVERTDTLGGNALHLKDTWSGEHIPSKVAKLIDQVLWNDRIIIYKESEVIDVQGFVGNFKTTIKGRTGRSKLIKHGIGILATGASIYSPHEYGYRTSKKVVTSIEFDKLHELKEKHVSSANTFVFIQCVGSREEDNMYCSKVCCTHSVQTAIELKKGDPKRNIFILYRDMRTYGQRETLYREARRMGIIFINYELHGKPVVEERGQVLDIRVWDHVLHRQLRIEADMVILASAIRPKGDSRELAKLFKVPVDSDGFFVEAHAKLRPVDFASDGMFVAGLAHYPKPMEETVAQALAASARAVTLLSKEQMPLDGVKAIVVEECCDGCAVCLDVCPYDAISMVDREGEGISEKLIAINVAQCKGCGVCQGACPKRGVYVAGFSLDQINSQIKAALDI